MEKRKKTKELSEDLRNQIVRKHEQSQGYKSVSKDLNVPVSTVRSVIKKFKAHDTVANLPRCGWKRKIDKRFQRKIVRMLDKEPRLTSKQRARTGDVIAPSDLNVTVRGWKTPQRWNRESPPKPKNVELPIKSKIVDNVEEGTIEAIIPKGNIASKVSLFESKRTSHKQIDFFATKNISQKKYVERTKLNFGKQVKGTGSKDISSLGKQANISSNSIGKKAENGHHEIKTDKKKEGTVVTSPSQIQMEHGRNGFELALPDKILKENILPSEKNEKYKKPPTQKNSNVDALCETIRTQSNGSKVDEYTKNTLTQSYENTSDNLVAVSADSEGGVCFAQRSSRYG
ncbi:unnamed protein product [Ranitomeya imitator]|uniref:Sleeping Beauty transposase HTH domain-containing protein n=1 Tax=Ranitomeya imitator TaxID=111125 RepID=A0ABN9MH05_9NEOB|nr:unnamed protein product [Ranitomeya imitator]